MKSRSDECMVAAYQDIYEYLENRGHKPKLNIMDNEASKAVQNYIKLQLKDDDFKKGFGLIRKWGEKDRQGIFRSKTNSADGKGHIYHDKRAKRF